MLVFYIWPKDLIKEMVTLGYYFYCNGHSRTKKHWTGCREHESGDLDGPGSAKIKQT